MPRPNILLRHGIQTHDVCVLIPAYNEEKNITRIVEAVKKLGVSVLVVDDGSRDETPLKIKSLDVHAILSSVNEGKGASLRKGFEWFLGQNYSALVMMDADGQHDPEELPLFIKALEQEGTDLVVGNRMGNPQNMPALRRITNRFMSSVISLIARQPIPDTQCGYRAIRRQALEKIKLHTTNFEIESEMLLEAARHKLGIRSVAIRSVYEGGHSHIHPLPDTMRFFKFLIEFLLHRR
jgi:glycosyltransferase involved in cell wall biosynthesis